VIVPAHNEEAVIARCLKALERDQAAADMELIVVCNGCTDRTDEVARQADPSALVISLPTASKTDALNAGDRLATRFPRIYLDADITMSIDAARATATILDNGPAQCAAPRPQFELSDRPRLIRWFYQTWQEIPYFEQAMVGSGVYALSEAGRNRFDDFPPITADDQFVMQLFTRAERFSLADQTFTVHTPTSVRGLLNMRTRVYRGNAELAATGHAGSGAPTAAGSTLIRLARKPSRFAPVLTYVLINLLAKRRSRRQAGTWERDNSARSIMDPPTP
jgi:hypothetical protein